MVYDGYFSHSNDEVKKAVELKVILVLLPANSTHLIQSLDIYFFKPFKSVLKKYALDFMLENDITTIPKKDTMTIGSEVWREVILDKTKNIASVFIVTYIWSLSFPAIQCRLKLFKDGGIADSEKNLTWMRCW